MVRANQRACYGALFDCGANTLVELAAGKRFIGTDRMGIFGALHTWGRDFTVDVQPVGNGEAALKYLAPNGTHFRFVYPERGFQPLAGGRAQRIPPVHEFLKPRP